MIKNQFYSTLRRQLRKINRLLQGSKYESLIGGKIKEISQDELYKYIKDEKVDYDDIKGIYSKAVMEVSNQNIRKYKSEAITEVKKEKETEVQTCLMNRRSYRLSKKAKDEKEEEYDISKVGFLVLFKVLRKFRNEHKEDLKGLSSQNSIDSPKSSTNRSEKCTAKNKRKRKEEESKKKVQAERKEAAKFDKFDEKYSYLKTKKATMPSEYKSLFSNMRMSEDDDTFNTPEGSKTNGYANVLQNKFTQQHQRMNPQIELIEEFMDDKSSPLKQMNNPNEIKQNNSQILAEESGGHGGFQQFLQVNRSPSKNDKLRSAERDHSINSNISHGFGYNEDFAPFGPQKSNMNLSKPQDLNFESFPMNPSTSYVGNMMNRTSDNSKNLNKQVSLTLNFLNMKSGFPHEFDNTNVYDLNHLSGCLNVSLSKNKRVVLEMLDDTHVQVKTVSKESSQSSNMKKDVSNPMLNISKNSKEPSFCLPAGGYPSFPQEMMNNKFNQVVDRIQAIGGQENQKGLEVLNTDKNINAYQKESFGIPRK